MTNLVKKYWLEILVFGVVFAILVIDLNPDFTFMNKAADSIGYIYSARFLYPAYHTSAPLYLLLGHVFLMIPIGTDAWRYALLSVFATMGTCVFVYLILRNLLKNKYWAILGVFLYGTSALVLSQSIIVETYPLVCLFATGAYYFAMKKKWYWVAVCLGAGCAIHLLGFIIAAVFFFGYKEYRKNWRALLLTVAFGLFYLYIPLRDKAAPQMWLPKNTNAVWAVISDTYSVIKMLVGTISIWDIPKRIMDAIGLLGVSVGVVLVIPIMYYLTRNKAWKTPIFWLIVLPVALFISELDMNTFDYTMVAIPFLIIIGLVGLAMILDKHRLDLSDFPVYYPIGKLLVICVVLSAVIFAGYNLNYFDIGRTLDKNMSAAKLMEVEYPKLPSNAIFMPTWGWEWEGIYLYNKENHENIIPVSEDMLNSAPYRDSLEAEGIKIQVSNNSNLSVAAKEMAQSIIALNDNVWTTVTTDPSTFGAKVVNANHDTSLVPMPDESLIQKNAVDPQWKFIPYNPYSIMDTSIFETKWGYVILSNKNLLLLIEGGVGGWMLYWIPYRLNERKKKREEKKSAEKRSQ
jgi:hypothetical protein